MSLSQNRSRELKFSLTDYLFRSDAFLYKRFSFLSTEDLYVCKRMKGRSSCFPTTEDNTCEETNLSMQLLINLFLKEISSRPAFALLTKKNVASLLNTHETRRAT